MSPTKKPEQIHLANDDLTDHEEVSTALHLAIESCAHLNPRIMLEGMAEMIGQLVKEGAITRDEVFGVIDRSLPFDPLDASGMGQNSDSILDS